MKRKKWDSKTKWHIVIEGFRGRAMAEICVEYNVAQSQYYKWRDQFLTEGYKLFDIAKTDQKQLDVERENKKQLHMQKTLKCAIATTAYPIQLMIQIVALQYQKALYVLQRVALLYLQTVHI